MNRQIYIVCVLYNPLQFKSRATLYRNFLKHMHDSGAKVLTVEVAFGHQPHEFTNPHNPFHVQLRSNAILWHKERLINLGFKRLAHVVPDWQYGGWFDTDITFGESDWCDKATHALSHLSIIQPFSTAINLNAKGDPMWNCRSTFAHFLETRGFHQTPPLPPSYTFKGHPGLAWCIRRDALEALGGLYEFCVAGSADTIMANAIKGEWSAYLPAPPSKGMIASMKSWTETAQKIIRGRFGYVNGSVLHHYHGRSEERGYEKRWEILSFHQFDPKTDLTLAENGMFDWTGNKPALEDDIRLSLSSRNEDAID